MKLHALEGQLAMSHTHDLPAVCLCSQFKLVGQSLLLGTQGMITANLERLRQLFIDRLPVMRGQ